MRTRRFLVVLGLASIIFAAVLAVFFKFRPEAAIVSQTITFDDQATGPLARTAYSAKGVEFTTPSTVVSQSQLLDFYQKYASPTCTSYTVPSAPNVLLSRSLAEFSVGRDGRSPIKFQFLNGLVTNQVKLSVFALVSADGGLIVTGYGRDGSVVATQRISRPDPCRNYSVTLLAVSGINQVTIEGRNAAGTLDSADPTVGIDGVEFTPLTSLSSSPMATTTAGSLSLSPSSGPPPLLVTAMIPTLPISINFSYRLDWGDGSVSDPISAGQTQTLTHTYTKVGTYTAKIIRTLLSYDFVVAQGIITVEASPSPTTTSPTPTATTITPVPTQTTPVPTTTAPTSSQTTTPPPSQTAETNQTTSPSPTTSPNITPTAKPKPTPAPSQTSPPPAIIPSSPTTTATETIATRPSPSGTLSQTSYFPGDVVAIALRGVALDTLIDISFDGIKIRSYTADRSDFNLNVIIPGDATNGNHTITLKSDSWNADLDFPITVNRRTTSPSPVMNEVGRTSGTNRTWSIVGLGLGAILLSLLLYLLWKRRQRPPEGPVKPPAAPGSDGGNQSAGQTGASGMEPPTPPEIPSSPPSVQPVIPPHPPTSPSSSNSPLPPKIIPVQTPPPDSSLSPQIPSPSLPQAPLSQPQPPPPPSSPPSTPSLSPASPPTSSLSSSPPSSPPPPPSETLHP